jgi:transcription antitermination factor NusG
MNMAVKLDQVFELHGIVTVGRGLEFNEPRIWRALTIRPSKEQLVADWLRRARIFAYWPNYTKRVPTASRGGGPQRQQHRLSAVIPGYLFMAVGLQSPDPWPIVDQTPGVIGFVRDERGNAAGLSNEDIDIIRLIEAGLNLPPPARVVHSFKTGDKVRFTDDLMCRWQAGRVTRLADDGRISVDTPGLLGRVVPIWVYPHQIEAM